MNFNGLSKSEGAAVLLQQQILPRQHSSLAIPFEFNPAYLKDPDGSKLSIHATLVNIKGVLDGIKIQLLHFSVNVAMFWKSEDPSLC